MPTIGPMLAAPATLAILYAERLLAGVTQQNYARLPRPGGVTIQTNHAAFVLGHLALYPPRVLTSLGQPAGAAAAPPEYDALFKAGADCRDDAEGTLYPPFEVLKAGFFDGYRTAAQAVAGAADDVLTQANPSEGRSRELFPTIGAMLAFYLGGHVQNHLGQMSAWRRAIGLPPA
ncbi:MAG TPA: DinB family protein [Phycisphaerae bacterium]|nr:DinB family protein [Phycisphaerae bacterium]